MINTANLIPMGLWTTNILLLRSSYFLITGCGCKTAAKAANYFGQLDVAKSYKEMALKAWKNLANTSTERKIAVVVMAVLVLGMMKGNSDDYIVLGMSTGAHVILSAWTQADVLALIEGESNNLKTTKEFELTK